MLRRMGMGFLALIALLFVLVGCQQVRLSPWTKLPEKPEGTLRVATWNVHYFWLEREEGRWGLSGWEARKGPMDVAFKALEADLVAFQEMESFSRRSDGNVNLTRDFLLDQNPDYRAAATGDARVLPPTQPIFYRPDVLEVLEEGWFHFSPTPDVLYSRGFDGATPSFASWAVFRRKADGAVFRTINIHFDAFSSTNRMASTELTAERMQPWLDAGETVILLGDFNALHGSRILAKFEALGIIFPKVPGATFPLSRGLHLFGAIDHIGVSTAAMAPSEPMLFNRKTGEVWASDHHPVLLDLELP